MPNRKAEPRFDRRQVPDRVLPYQSGELPEDFVDRLNRLKEASGLTWSAFSQAIGADRKQVRRWRKKGVKPSGGPYHCLVRFACLIPGGLKILLEGDGFRITFWNGESES